MQPRNMFDSQWENNANDFIPLSTRMRPQSFDDFLGQQHIIGENKVLRRTIEIGEIPSIILWGPPGSGKTTLANLIAKHTKSQFISISAVTSGVPEVRKLIGHAQVIKREQNCKTILFIDEIHRFNKAQQHVILPHIENGTITLIGATTENPSFEIISPLLSRTRVFTLESLTLPDLRNLIFNALNDHINGLSHLNVQIEEKAIEFLINMANGDARIILNALELSSIGTKPDKDGVRTVTLETMEQAFQTKTLNYDRDGSQHYDTISAFIKSIRGSDPDASIYWLARMIESGEDPRFIARRLIILASEDIGLAEPSALSLAIATQQTIQIIGMPEAKIALAQATIFMATCPKSNSAYNAIQKATYDIQNMSLEPVPVHLRNAVTPLDRQLRHGELYKYPHDYNDHYVAQEYLPNKLRNKRYYEPSNQGKESDIRGRIQNWRKEMEA